MIEYENLQKLNAAFQKELEVAFETVVNKGRYILGNEVESFEKNFAAYINTTYSIGVANGLDALTLAIKALNLEVNSEILVPSNTYIAGILAIINAGYKPVLVEPDIETYNIDPEQLAEKVTNKTKAVLIVHLYGRCCNMDAIQTIASKYKLFIIEDCAQAHGATFKGKHAGSFGDIAAWSFYPTKNLGALGDAGAITCSNEFFYKRIKLLRNYGSSVKYYNEEVGVNSRLDELQAGFLNVKLKHLQSIVNHKRVLAQIYNNHLLPHIIKPKEEQHYFHAYHIYNIRVSNRDLLRAHLLNNNIITDIHYPVPPHKQIALKRYFNNEVYLISEEIHNTTLSLPISLIHTEEDIHKVCNCINNYYTG
jgi:dTDP-4-amino-4,6-dideoxygalactose transaminase